eukprot:GHVN01074870.1.p1 GENE.GHVN01074870.1~~GHVN01074870.1.p1  ORF type:complete len:627 (-),score=31.43 GHVN01074870.1:1514-3394(-)
MSENYTFNAIVNVPTYSALIDTVFSMTQKKTPTVIRKSKEIGVIRDFYMRKVKYTQETFTEKFGAILSSFPKLDEIHPFYADLLNVLYDRDHYKIALARVASAKRLIEGVTKEYVKLLKYADSLYRCKRLKIAALGRMAKIVKKQKDGFVYLEQVRQHLSRLPAIDPETRTLVLCGYPNVGKSSFMNRITRAHVDVQAYPFTTKSLYVGHMDHDNLRWQVVDTPGILDRPLEDRNTIEMQAVTALAHLRACILYFFDLSETCGYTIEQQTSLFCSLMPLFANKKLLIVFSKADLATPASLSEEERAILAPVFNGPFETVTVCAPQDEGVLEARSTACSMLLAARIEQKAEASKNVLNMLRVSQPADLGCGPRLPCIPVTYKKIPRPSPEELETGLETQAGGAGIYNADLKKNYFLDKEEKNDVIPEIVDGKNIMDFVAPDIDSRLHQLSAEEDFLSRTGAYDFEEISEKEKALRELSKAIEDRRGAQMEKVRLEKRGGGFKLKRKIELARRANEGRRMDFDENDEYAQARKRLLTKESQAGSVSAASRTIHMPDSGPVSLSGNVRDRRMMGIGTERDLQKVRSLLKLVDRKRRYLGKKGVGDNEIPDYRPKHLFSGKMGRGKRSHR